MSQEDRSQNIEEFKKNKTKILISSDLLSRGIDISNVKYVINFDLPNDKDVYKHRINRSGRSLDNGFTINLINCNNFSELVMLNDLKTLHSFNIDELTNTSKSKNKNIFKIIKKINSFI